MSLDELALNFNVNNTQTEHRNMAIKNKVGGSVILCFILQYLN